MTERSTSDILEEIRQVKKDLKALEGQIQLAVRKRDKKLGEKLLREHEKLGKRTMDLVQEMHEKVQKASPDIPEDMKPFGESLLAQLDALLKKEGM